MTDPNPPHDSTRQMLARTASPAASWIFAATGIGSLRNAGLSGHGVRVGHLDTGIHWSARDLLQRVQRCCDFAVDGTPGDDGSIDDHTGHGTRTAALVAGDCRGRMRIGVAPGVQLVVGRVFEGGASIVRILRGLDWLGEQHVPIALLCAGLPTQNPVFGPMLGNLRRQGMLVVGPIGNAGNGHWLQPGDDPSVLSVGAVDRNGRVPAFSGSRRGRFARHVLAPDLLAPGVAVPTATRAGGRELASGTSIAAAVVAGAAALLLEAVPDASAGALHHALCAGAVPPDDATRTHVCAGRLDAAAALAHLRASRPDAAAATVRSGLDLAAWRDPRLRYQLEHGEIDRPIVGVYVLAPETDERTWHDLASAALARCLVRPARDAAEHRTIRVPRGRALIVTARAEVHAELMSDSAITYASAADAGRMLHDAWRPPATLTDASTATTSCPVP